MTITEVRIKLMNNENECLHAFCSITFDNAFVVRDLKIVGKSGGFLVAMPSRKLGDRCPHCGTKNHLMARFCNDCGIRLDDDRCECDDRGRYKLHTDIAHPINHSCRAMIQEAALRAFEEEKKRAKQPGYVCRYNDREPLEEMKEKEHEFGLGIL